MADFLRQTACKGTTPSEAIERSPISGPAAPHGQFRPTNAKPLEVNKMLMKQTTNADEPMPRLILALMVSLLISATGWRDFTVIDAFSRW
jgi:hypothetical protein